MLSYLQTISVVLICIGVVLLVVFLMNHRMEETTRKRANGVNGWQLSILGAIYAVALGFMLSDAWLAYQSAVEDVRGEASAVRLIDRTAGLMPANCADMLQQQTQRYVAHVIDEEWPAMAANLDSRSMKSTLNGMWAALSNCEVHDSAARGSVIQAIAELQARRDARVQDSDEHLPLMMWAVLLVGGVVVIAASCLLSNERQSIHCFHVASLTMLISLTLLAIFDLDRPFAGAIHIDPTPFQIVRSEIQVQNRPQL